MPKNSDVINQEIRCDRCEIIHFRARYGFCIFKDDGCTDFAANLGLEFCGSGLDFMCFAYRKRVVHVHVSVSLSIG